MAASLLVPSSFFVGRVRRLSKGWSFAATQSSGDSAYSPNCVEQEFSEVRSSKNSTWMSVMLDMLRNTGRGSNTFLPLPHYRRVGGCEERFYCLR